MYIKSKKKLNGVQLVPIKTMKLINHLENNSSVVLTKLAAA